jgi:hypothetical protein
MGNLPTMAAPTTNTKHRTVHCSKHAFAPIASFRPENAVAPSVALPAQRHQNALGRAGLASESPFTGDDPVNAIDPNGLDCGLFSFACSAYDSAAGGVKTAAKDTGHYVATHKAAIAEVAGGVAIVAVVVVATVATGGVADFAFAAIGTAGEEGGVVGALEGFSAAAHAGFVFLLPATLALFGGAMIARAGPSLFTGDGSVGSPGRCP